jgi:hypothetical protein
MELAKSLSAARETARGRMAHGRALENRGETYSPEKGQPSGDTVDMQQSQADATHDQAKVPRKNRVPVVSEQELEEMTIPDFPSYSDRI